MNLRTYLNLYQLMQKKDASHEEHRAFGLANPKLEGKEYLQLDAWLDAHDEIIDHSLSDTIDSFLYGTTLIVSVLAFIVGIFSGIALLHYNGSEPVNVVYFIVMVVFVPLLTMTLALFSMLHANKRKSTLIHITPAYWMEKIIAFFSKEKQEQLQSIKINPLIANWIVIVRSQWIALSFSLGLIAALLLLITTKDIAFSWSTTLDIDAKTFHNIVNWIALPWKEWLPSAVPSLDLIEQSRYYRLGEHLSEKMIKNAASLGAWWKFLAISTLFYAIILRLLIYFLAKWKYKKALKKSITDIKGVKNLLKEMNEPYLQTSDEKGESYLHEKGNHTEHGIPHLDLKKEYDALFGWAIDENQLKVLAEHLGIKIPVIYETGGKKTLEEDRKEIEKAKGDVLMVVKAWEPPLMDFLDFLDMLSKKVNRVTVVPIGTEKEKYIPKVRDIEVWEKRIATLPQNNIGIYT